jgi:hypothetical protein
MNQSEAGKLGAAKSRLISNAQKALRVIEYNKAPKLCKQCNVAIIYDKRNNVFCNHSCAATYGNEHNAKSVKWKCLCCDKENTTLPHKVAKYCNKVCAGSHKRQQTFEDIKDGKISVRGTIRKTFIDKYGHKCFECDLSEWRGFTIPLELDHIDGNAGNNDFNNLRLLCPNCHSITDTWKGKNKGNGRAARGLPLN